MINIVAIVVGGLLAGVAVLGGTQALTSVDAKAPTAAQVQYSDQ